MSAHLSSSLIRFGTFELNLQSGELRNRGQKVRLQEQPLRVLARLLERPGEIVTREELRSELWPADTFVDFDHGLNAAIKRLRDALGESADAPVFIETLARRGYRFIAPVNGSALSGVEIAAAERKSFSLTPWTALAGLVPIVVAVLLWAAWRLPPRHTDAIERKLTSNSSENSVSSADISPDGKYLAYSDNSGIYVKLIRTGETHSVPLPPNFSGHVDNWFPDGSHLLVSRNDQPAKPRLWSISVFGGSPRLLADDASGGSVSPDGARIAFCRADLTYDSLLGREVWIMRSDGTDPIKVAPDKGSRVGAPVWSPDGKRIAYVRTSMAYDAPTRAVELNEWQSAGAQTLFADNRLATALHWLPDGRLIYVLDAQQPFGRRDSSVWTMSPPRGGKISQPAKRIVQGNGAIRQIAGSADGKVLITLRENWSPSIYLSTLAATGTPALMPRRFTLDESANVPTGWTPDSAAVLFYSDRNGASEIFKQAIDRPLAENLVTAAEQLSQPRVTPDGSEILYISTPKSTGPETRSSIFAIPINGGTPRLVLEDVAIFTVQCARLPSTLCLYSVTKGNTRETFRFDVRSGKSTDPPQIDPEGFWSLSPDGSQRAFVPVASSEGTIQLRSTSSNRTRDLVVKGWNGLMHIDWSADGKSLLVGWHNQERDSALLNVTLDGTVSVLLRSSNFIGYAIPSPNGRLLAILQVAPAKNVWQTENF